MLRRWRQPSAMHAPRRPSDALARLVRGERLGRVDVAERWVPGHDLGHARERDAEALAEDRQHSARLHLAEPRQLEESCLKLAPALRLAPDPRGVAAIALDDERTQRLDLCRHRAREAVERGPLAEDAVELGGVRRGDAPGVEVAQPAAEVP